MPAFLVPLDQGQTLIPLEKAIVLIGRQADCDISLTQSRKISRKHCCIAQVNSSFVVRDLGSTNGVFLNGQRIKKEATLSMGDDLVIGDVRFRVQPDPTPVAADTGRNGQPTKTRIADKKEATKNEKMPPADLSLEIPVALSEEEPALEIEEISNTGPLRKPRIDDVILLDDEDVDDDKPFELAEDV